jgi:3-oxoacyl-[acyl-carrier protein] reductase
MKSGKHDCLFSGERRQLVLSCPLQPIRNDFEESEDVELGIKGKTAIVCAASKGLGKGCARALASEGVNLVINARSKDILEATASEIAKATRVKVMPVAADITTQEGRAAVLAVCPEPDILITNCGGPPAGDFRDWEREIWIKALDANMLTPIALIRATLDGMIARRFGRIVNITSASVKNPYPSLGLSTGARAGLTGFTAGLARQTARYNVTINNLLPGSHATDRSVQVAEAEAKSSGKTVDQVLQEHKAASNAGRFGTVEEFGAACAFLCSVHAGNIVGQNLLLDGGSYPGIL